MTELAVDASRILSDDAFDSLVARYAPIGAELRRRQRVLATALLSGVVVAMSLATLAWRADFSPAALFTGASAVEELRTLVTSELDALSAGQAELVQQRLRFEARLAAFEGRSSELEARQAEIQARGERLEAALAEMDEQQNALLAERARTPAVDDEIDALEARRQDLVAQRRHNAVQEGEVASELGQLRHRRESLEAERRGLEQQRRDLEAMLERARGLPEASTAAPQPEPGRTSAGVMAAKPLAFAAIDDGWLSGMRGGIMLGDGMDISIGLTRRASIDGIGEVMNTLQLDGMSRGLGLMSTPVLDPLILQSGSGNEIGAGIRNTDVYSTILQNTLDDRRISTEMIYDISIQDVSKAIDGLSAGDAIGESLYLLQ